MTKTPPPPPPPSMALAAAMAAMKRNTGPPVSPMVVQKPKQQPRVQSAPTISVQPLAPKPTRRVVSAPVEASTFPGMYPPLDASVEATEDPALKVGQWIHQAIKSLGRFVIRIGKQMSRLARNFAAVQKITPLVTSTFDQMLKQQPRLQSAPTVIRQPLAPKALEPKGQVVIAPVEVSKLPCSYPPLDVPVEATKDPALKVGRWMPTSITSLGQLVIRIGHQISQAVRLVFRKLSTVGLSIECRKPAVEMIDEVSGTAICGDPDWLNVLGKLDRLFLSDC